MWMFEVGTRVVTVSEEEASDGGLLPIGSAGIVTAHRGGLVPTAIVCFDHKAHTEIPETRLRIVRVAHKKETRSDSRPRYSQA